MGKVWQIQSNLSQGELDPRVTARIDLAAYYNGLKRARNVVPIVQGGVSRRAGSELIDLLGGGSEVRLFPFNFSNTAKYLLVFTSFRMAIYKDGTVLQTNINGGGNDWLTTTMGLALLPDMDIAQDADSIIITHQDLNPLVITRTSDTAWTESVAALTNIPQFDFDDASSPTPTSEVQTLTFTNQSAADVYKLALEGILTEEIGMTADSATNAKNIQIALQELPNTASTGVTVAAVDLQNYTVTFAGGSAKDWDLLTGLAVNVKSASFTIVSVEVTPGVARAEDVWSSGRGWPRTNSFHEGRLFFGGSKSRVQTLWGSNVGDVLNFNAGRARDDQGIDITLDTDQLNAIQGLISNRSLQIFTTGQEFFIPASPITPGNVAAIPQTNFGSKRVRPITIDGRTLFIQATGKAIREFVQSSDVTNIYNANSVSLLAPHLVVNPLRAAVSRGEVNVDSSYAYFVNDDGTILVYTVLGAEGFTGFSLWQTPVAKTSGDAYTYLDIVQLNDEIFATVKSTTSPSPNTVRLVRFNQDFVTDLGIQAATPGSGTFTGLGHLEGEEVQIIGDGAFEGTAIVTSGEVTVDASKTTTEVGLAFSPIIEIMPLNINLQNGSTFCEPLKTNRVCVDFYQSLGIIVRNSLGEQAKIPDKQMGVNPFDPPTPRDGREDVWLLGWEVAPTIIITQDTPVKMTILGIGVEVGI